MVYEDHILSATAEIAQQNRHAQAKPVHLYLALMGEGAFDHKLDSKEKASLEDWLQPMLRIVPKSLAPGALSNEREVTLSNSLRKVMAYAKSIQRQMGHLELSSIHFLHLLATAPTIAFKESELADCPIDFEALALPRKEAQKVSNDSNTKNESSSPGSSVLDRYLIQLDEKMVSPIYGRDRLIHEVLVALGKQFSANVLLVGEPGVGKSSLIHGIAGEIQKGNIPPKLKNATIFKLEVGLLLADSSFKGDLENKLNTIFKHAKSLEGCILFIDEIDALLNPENGKVANLCKAELQKGGFNMIGSVTPEKYRQVFDTDEGLKGNFEVKEIKPLEPALCVRILSRIMASFQQQHNLQEVPTGVLEEAVHLSRRCIRDRFLPGAAISLLDVSMSALNLMLETHESQLKTLENELDELLLKVKGDTLNTELTFFNQELNERLSPIFFSEGLELPALDDLKTTDEVSVLIKGCLEEARQIASSKERVLNINNLRAITAKWTGIPVDSLSAFEKDKLLNLSAYLSQHVIGQEHVTQMIQESLTHARSGLVSSNKPKGVFFFSGPSGTGKTEMAKTIAKFLFGTEETLFRFDMSEYQEQHSAALLLGAPPGYIGYKDGGILVNRIRKEPYSVLLFDEIEKAHPDVFNPFLNMLDDAGVVTDKQGRKGYFQDAIIIFTSNVGVNEMKEIYRAGKKPEKEDLRELLKNITWDNGKKFKPEFVGRLDEIAHFNALEEEALSEIFDLHLKKHLTSKLDQMGIQFTLSSEAKAKLLKEGYSPDFGARPLIGVIRDFISKPISRMLVAGEIEKGDYVNADWREDTKLTFTKNKDKPS